VISEERLREAAHQAGRALADSVPDPETCSHVYSPSFQKKMDRLIRRRKQRKLSRPRKAVAALLVVFLLAGSVFLGGNAQAREFVFGWLSERVDSAQHYFFEGPALGNQDTPRYALAEIPQGYTEWDTLEDETGCSTIYVNEAGQFLRFEYQTETAAGSTDIFFDTDGMEKASVQVNGVPADFYCDDTGTSGNLIVWQDEETDTLLFLSGYFTQEELIDLAENVITTNP
jgi:hypothetical protein